MKAFIPAAGLGTRLRPFTLTNPKALVPVDGVPMLQRVILRLKDMGFDDIVVNLHHFGDKIEEFVRANDSFGVRIRFSDERDLLLDTGGGLLHASRLLAETPEPFLVHNVDILSNADLSSLMRHHLKAQNDATLLVSSRNSSRRLLFDAEDRLLGWRNVEKDIYRPSSVRELCCGGADADAVSGIRQLAFSGIHVLSPLNMLNEMDRQHRSGVFSIIDFYLDSIGHFKVRGVESSDLRLIDIGKPQTLAQASDLLKSLS